MTIWFVSQREKLQFVEIIDEKRVFLPSGLCLIDCKAKGKNSATLIKADDSQSTSLDELGSPQSESTMPNTHQKTESVSILMRPTRNEPVELLIRVHCCLRSQQAKTTMLINLMSNNDRKSSRMSRVSSKIIKIPKFNMFLPIPSKLKQRILKTTTSNLANQPNNVINELIRNANGLQNHQSLMSEPIKLDYSLKDAATSSRGSVSTKVIITNR